MCGRRSRLHWGQGWSRKSSRARCERRRPFFDFDSLTFGRAMATRSLPGGRFLRHRVAILRRSRRRLQRLHPSLHGGERPGEVSLQLLQLLESVGLGLADDLVGLGLGLAHGLSPQPLGPAQHLVLLDGLFGALVGPGHDPRRLGVGLRDEALLLLHGPAGLVDLLGKVEAELVDQLHHLVLVDHDLVGEGHVPRVVDHVLEAVEDLLDLGRHSGYRNFSFRRVATMGGTNSPTSRPWLAMSLRILDETKMWAKLDIRKMVWMSGASLRFMRACWSSASKSE